MSVRRRAQEFVLELQERICTIFQWMEQTKAGGDSRFVEDTWKRPGGGGGRTRVMTGGRILEKAGVNVSVVWGDLPDGIKDQMPGAGSTFFATGLSLVLHPVNPHVPTTHANFRYIERSEPDAREKGLPVTAWFGGGADLTPYVLYEEDAKHFHALLADACRSGPPEKPDEEKRYPRFKRWCDEYFWNTHREEARGVGGIFYDHLMPREGETLEELMEFWMATGQAFIPAYLPILQRRWELPYDDELRQWQLQRRGRYVEFNLLHDRGTRFGLKTKGRVESILMSLPPLVRWDYDVRPRPGSREARLIKVLRFPREWLDDE